MSSLNLKDYVHCAPYVGETVALNHDDCPAGTDTRRRLYLTVKQTAPDMMLGFCHNCGFGGAIRLHKGRSILGPTTFIGSDSFSREADDISMPQNITHHKRQMPASARAFVNEYCPDVLSYYYPTNHSIIHGIWEWVIYGSLGVKENYLGYIERFLNYKRQKYNKHLKKDRPSIATFGHTLQYTMPFTTVIVEDHYSAMKIAKHTDYKATCIFGVHVSPEDLYYHFNKYGLKEAVVWLDNDSDYVVRKAVQLQKFINLMGIKCSLVRKQADPKRESIDSLKSTILSVLEV